MGMRFLHGILVFNLLTLVFSLAVLVSPVYAAPWFTTYGAGVLSGSTDAQSIKTTQPYFDPSLVFKSALVQPGVITPNPTMPSFVYGGIISRGGFDVKQTNLVGITSPTDKDAFAKQVGIIGDALPNFQRFVDVATPISDVCNKPCNKLLTECTFIPGIYKAELPNCVKNALNALSGITYENRISGSGLVVLVQNDPGSANDITINNEIKSLDANKRLVIVTNKPITIQSGVGTNPVSQPGYISQVADIQAMLVTTSTDDPSIEVQAGSTKSLKIEGPLISKGKVRFRRDADAGLTKWPGVFVQFNPFYITELAKLDASLNIFGSSTTRWIYD